MTITAQFKLSYPGFTLDVDLNLPGQGITALFGGSGSGKTTLLRAIAGLERVREGRLEVDGKVWQDGRTFLPTHKRPLGYVFQEANLFEHLSVRANLEYGMRRSNNADPSGFPSVVALLGLAALLDREPGGLSGGERQRVAIARALLTRPRLLLMDEPLASLDAPRKREILPYLERLRDELRVPIIYVSHAIEEVVRLANQMVLLNAGKVMACGSPEELGERLDLRPLFGDFESGAVIDARVEEYDAAFELSTLAFDGGRLRVPGNAGALGTQVRVRVRARDVSIALQKPDAISIQNIFSGEVEYVLDEPGAYAGLRLRVGGTRFSSRVTRESVSRLGLSVGTRVFLLVKSVSFDTETLSIAPGVYNAADDRDH